MKTIALLLASASCLLSAVPANAKNSNAPLTVTGSHSDDPDTIRVSYRDLNLANAADVDALRARVERETLRACGAIYNSSAPEFRWACHDVALSAVEPQVRVAIAHAVGGQRLAADAVVIRFARR